MPPTSKKPSRKHHLPKILIVLGIVLIAGAILILKNQPSQTNTTADPRTAEEQLEMYMEEGIPVFLFVHSNSCQSCLDMMAVVDAVYPEFKEDVALVDVNVYDPANQNLLQRAQIRSIPTQVFLNPTGQGRVMIGVMTPEALRVELTALAEASQ